ncbi:uncharacterized protein TM35_000332330 [Trypanosoma theileri]|uniref:Uncharacterized protein n=1 Tax=Trypanosoma theileri TaxID=67003 RepID=A0A1X0NM39_9TRYP|nr:uncharacterized protein TM35_000332330 [Trypanosoma theileri]ORC85776.1 hypothetical protein TM35_000332330 [Trypanosoma theileri]
MEDWLKEVDVQYPGAKTCQRVGDDNNKKYAEIATKVRKVADGLKQGADTTMDLVKKLNKSVESVSREKIERELRKHVDVMTTEVQKSKEAIDKAREARDEARVLVGCTVFLGNLEELRSEKKKEALKFYTDDLEEKNSVFKLLEWRDLINRTRAKEAEVDMLVQNLTFALKRSRGISNEVAQSLVTAVTAAEAAVERFEKAKGKVKVPDAGGEYDVKVESLRGEKDTAMQVKKEGQIPNKNPSLIPDENKKNETKEPRWGETVGSNVGASPVTGARIREHPEKEKISEIAKELNRVLEEEKQNLKQKKIEEKKAFEEMKQAEIRRKEEERLAEEEKARLEREALGKKAREERARQERATAEKLAEEERKKQEKLAEEEKARKAREAELAKNAKKKKDGSSSPALVHSPLLLLVLLCVLGCTLVC